MDFEGALISRVLHHPEEILKVIDSRVSDDLFVDHAGIWKFVTESYREHGGLPPANLVQERFPEFEVLDLNTPITLFISELKKRHIHNTIMEHQGSLMKHLKGKDPMAALEIMQQCVLKVENETRSTKDFNFRDQVRERLDRYNEAQLSGGITGIPTPWGVLNEATQGFNPGELIMIAGRGGVGKSWCEVVLSWFNWKAGCLPLLFSNEMAIWQIIRRLDAVNAQLPYQRFKAGQLTTDEFFRWERTLEDLKNKPDFWVIGDDEGMIGVTGIAAKIQRYHPAIVYIDGGYLVSDDRKAKEGWEKFKNVCWDLKKLALRENIPIVMTHQFSKEGKGLEGTADTLKYGDVQMWFDLIIGVYQDENLKNNKEMLMKIAKHREGMNKDWVCDWDLDYMKFDVKTLNDLPQDAKPYDKQGPVDY
jgi:replicative DNA helicase